MKKIAIIFVVVLYSCSDFNNRELKERRVSTIITMLNKGKHTSLPLVERLKCLNSALFYAQTNDSLSNQILYSKCNLHYKLEQYDSLFLHGKRLKMLSDQTSNFLELGKFYHLMAYYHEKVTANIDSAFYYHNLSKNQFIKIGDSTRISRRLVRLGYIQRTKGDYFGAKETLTDALKYINPQDSNYLANLYNELGAINGDLKNEQEAFLYYNLAIETTNSENDVLIYKNNLAVDLTEKKEYDKGVHIFEELLSNKNLSKDPINLARVLNNYAFVLWEKGEKNTGKYFTEALNIRKEHNNTSELIDSHLRLGEVFLLENPRVSEKHLDTVIQLSRQIGLPSDEAEALSFLMHLEPRNIQLRDRYIFLKDSMYNNELQVKTQFAKMKYDDEQEKEQILKLEKEAAEKRAELAEQKTQKIFFISLMGFLILSGATFLYFLIQRHKRERLQEVYNTEKRISQDLHDGLANDIFGLMTKLHNQDNTNEDIINKLDDIYNTTRQISHENATIRTGDGFIEELKDLMENYQDKHTNILAVGLSGIDWCQLEDHKCVIVQRAIRELLVNMKKHAQASLVSLQFRKQKKYLIINYSDNGVGFTRKTAQGIGLLNTENRILSISGRIIFDIEQGTGAKITISIPF